MRNFYLSLVILLVSSTGFAQESTPVMLTPQHYWKYSPDLSEEELYQYERLLYMSKDDWELFRTDPRYNDARIRDIYHANKGKIKFEDAIASAQKTLPPGDCDCWIEPDATYTQTDPNDWPNCSGGGPGVDCWLGPINLGFTFCFFGQDFSQVYFTSKGTIAFGGGYFDWTPHEFPNPVGTDTQHDHICAFWADFDFRATGEFYYKTTSQALYVNYVDVGYYSNHSDKKNTFQIILTPEGSDVLPAGQNVQFCYRDMQWAHGDVGGSSGFSGPTPTNVGADRVSGNSHAQFGRFNLNNGNYNGPYGQAANQQDGVNWLDNRTIGFSTCQTAANIPPMPTTALPCDTIDLCIGDSYNLTMQFLSPETGQNTSITYTQTGSGLTASATSGNTANLTASFAATASNIGLNTITITATDNGNPAQSTVLTYVFNVLNQTAPPISISGNLVVCAGGSSELTATPGFDAYEWSTGCTTPDCTVSQAGDVTVTGYTGACASSATVYLDATNYFIPDLALPNPVQVCPGTNPVLCTADEWASYFWEVLPTYPGQIVAGSPIDEQCVEVSGLIAGNYRVTVTDSTGCQGRKIQNVTVIQSFIDPINEENAGAYCDGFEPIEFTGGYSNPASGNFTIYLQSTNPTLGWQGSYITVNVTNAGGVTTSTIFTATTGFSVVSVPITGNDFIEIVYTSSGTGDANNYITVLNCVTNNPIQIPATGTGLTAGVIYSSPSGCASQPLAGQWSVTGPTGWTLSTTSQYNTTFNATNLGIYTLCFTDPACAQDHCYEIEFNEQPSLDMSISQPLLLCNNETANVEIDVVDAAGVGEITWTGTGVVAAANELSAVVGPFTNYTTTTVSASITNGCGTASDSFNVEYQPNVPEPSLSDQFICNGASVTLDPIPSNQDNPNLVYVWTPNNTGSTYTVNSNGTYSVSVSNDCDQSNTATAVITLVPAATLNPVPQPSILECENSSVTLTVGVPDGYSILWNNNQTTESITVNQSGTYSYNVVDNNNCNTSVTGSSAVVITTAPFVQGSSSLNLLCPGECATYTLDAPSATNFEWETSCGAMNISQTDNLYNFCSANVPASCLDGVITLYGTASNACGSSTASYQIIANACQLIIPDVFTPNGDGINDSFEILGLENYTSARLLIFDRWGGKVFESDNYANTFNGDDLPEGTYFYVLELPYGTNPEIEGNITLLR